ncbi:hypothetical protein PARC_a1696 [Pseudoalteromonas arctica A 37-1-2]|uniref:Uncharacterized protein n=1 Tax=Pseudoalteromonas arctica A 37-1-2 TaxID=1117313 RepID=A0A290S4Y7_9GAMM|nr:hypothetical protein PARC_a1696 [Pseudoalteromonas arctica A 37-1-2]
MRGLLVAIGIIPHFFVFKVQPLFQSLINFIIEFKIKLIQLLKVLFLFATVFL